MFRKRSGSTAVATAKRSASAAIGAKLSLTRTAVHRTVELLESRLLFSTYFVSTAGLDSNAGSLTAPLRTIQHATDLAQPGDTVMVRGGTYRETVTPARSGTPDAHITFQPYNNESVTISGADLLGGWLKYNSTVYRTSEPWDLGDGRNQVFVDGQMMNEARWPNTTLDVSRPAQAISDSATLAGSGTSATATLLDSDLPAGGSAWNGATIHFLPGQAWVAQTGTVTSASAGKITFSYNQLPDTSGWQSPGAGMRYYLSGKFVALDSGGEWYRDPTDSSLYLWTPAGDDAGAHVVEAKRRDFAMDLSGKSYVDVRGFKLFAATITTDASSSHVVIDGISASYVSHFTRVDNGWESVEDSGIMLRGPDSVIRNSTIAYSAGNGILLTGPSDRAENNVIHDVDYSATDAAGIRMEGSDQLVYRNSVSFVGRSGIQHSHSTRVRILNNDIHDVGLQNTDLGGIYCYGGTGGGGEIAYNRIYNVMTGGFGACAIFLDNNSSGYVVHHNLTWNSNYGLKMNRPSRNNLIDNNTLLGGTSVATHGSGDMNGTYFRNNIFRASTPIDATATQQNNLYSATDPLFVNAAAGDYRLAAGSPAIDAGLLLAPYTNGFTGLAPDDGAFEFNLPAWIAGAAPGTPSFATPPAPASLLAADGIGGVTLTWKAVAGAVGYNVYSSTNGLFARLNAAPFVGLSYIDIAAVAGATTAYRVTAVDASGNESFAASVAVTRPAAAPLPPVGLLAIGGGPDRISLSWLASADATSYRIERMAAGGAFVPVAFGLTGTSYLNTGLSAGSTYTYRVFAQNYLGESPASVNASASTAILVPAAPTNLVATSLSSSQVNLAWSDVAGETGFAVERSADNGGTWGGIGGTATGITSFADPSVAPATAYAYRVRAMNAAGTSAPSAVLVVSTAAAPQAQAMLTSVDVRSTPAGATTVVQEGKAYDVIAGGNNIYGNVDGFSFDYVQRTGDFDVKVRVQSMGQVVSTTRGGLMARESLAPDSRNVFAGATAADGHRFTYRALTGGTTAMVKSGAVAYPNVWVRLRRVGNTFTAYRGTDGATWTQTGSTTMALPATVYFGLATSSNNGGATTLAQYRDLADNLAGPAPVPPPVSMRSARSTLQAETYSDMLGIKATTTAVGYTSSGDWLKYSNVDFGAGVSTFKARVALPGDIAGRQIEVRVGSPSGALAGVLTTTSTGGWSTYATQSAAVSGLSGVKDIYLVFQGGEGIANLDWFTFA